MSDGRDYLRNMWTRNSTNDGMVVSVEEAKNRGKKFETKDLYEIEHMPNQRMHKIVSFIKSGLRLVACIFGMTEMYVVGFALLFMAEVVGIYEEMV
jgi:hypothetical protein